MLLMNEEVVAQGNDTMVAADLLQTEQTNGFSQMGLCAELLQALTDLGFNQPTPVQQQVIPLASKVISASGEISYQDLMVSSQTGSGKTAAFLLPILQGVVEQITLDKKLERDSFEKEIQVASEKGEAPPKKAKRKNPRDTRNLKAPTPYALIMCPTRELAQQVAQDAINLLKHCRGLRVANIVGGMPYPVQIAKLQNANVVVATPGRLLDLQSSMQIKLDCVQFLVLDEADRLLDLGFSEDLNQIDELTRGRSQTLMFSATFGQKIQQLARNVMNKPERIEMAAPHEKHANIKQVLYWSDNATHKRKLLDHLLRDTAIQQAIVFASTQIECDGLASDLQERGFNAVALHGALNQRMRNSRLSMLRDGRIQFLVATDVAARGIDVPTITHVFNYGLPMKVEDYTHRIGRTGRAGRSGSAITLAQFAEKRKIFDIEGFTKNTFEIEKVAGMEPTSRAPLRGEKSFGKAGGGSARHGQNARRGGFGGAERRFDKPPHAEGFAGGSRREGVGARTSEDSRRSYGDRGSFSHGEDRRSSFHSKVEGAPRDQRREGRANNNQYQERGHTDRFDRGSHASPGRRRSSTPREYTPR